MPKSNAIEMKLKDIKRIYLLPASTKGDTGIAVMLFFHFAASSSAIVVDNCEANRSGITIDKIGIKKATFCIATKRGGNSANRTIGFIFLVSK
jgi:hypothetical protein